MRSPAPSPKRAWLLLAALCLPLAAHSTPSTTWGNFPQSLFPMNTPVHVATAGGTTFDVTVSTGGTQGVYGDNGVDTLGVAETGLAYDSLYAFSIFNGGGFATVPTTITYSNIQPGPAHHRGLLLVGDVNGASSPITVGSSVAGRVATWSVAGTPFADGPSNSYAIAWNAASGQFTTSALSGNDSRCIVIDVGPLGSDGTITLSLNQHLNDGIVYSLGEELTGTLDAPAAATPALELAPPRPDPARGTSTLVFGLPSPGYARMLAYDVAGRRLATLADGGFAAGTHAVRWDLRDASGAAMPAGLVFVRLETPAGTRTRRLLVVR
jgi:hypothetical protein